MTHPHFWRFGPLASTVGRRVVFGLVAFVSVSLTGCADLFAGSGSGELATRAWFAPIHFQFLWPATPGVGNGVVMVPDGSGIAAFDAQTGKPRWRTTLFTGRAGNAGDVVIIADRACIADNFGGTGCVDIESGQTRWTAPSDDSWSYQHAGDIEGFYYGTHEHEFMARDPGDGTVKWKYDYASGTAFQSLARGVALHGNTLYATTTRWLNANGFRSTGDLLAIDARTGAEIWRYTQPGNESDFQAGPAIDKDIAVVSDTYSHRLRAISLTTHEQIWESAVSDSGYVTSESQPVIHNDTVYAASSDTQVYAYDLRTGRLLWQVRADAGSLGSVAVCGRLVLAVPWTTGPLVAVDRRTQRVSKPHVTIGEDELFSRIAVSGNTAYAAGMKGVYAFRCAE